MRKKGGRDGRTKLSAVDLDCVRLHGTPQLNEKMRSFHQHGLLIIDQHNNTVINLIHGMRNNSRAVLILHPSWQQTLYQYPNAPTTRPQSTLPTAQSPGLVIMSKVPWVQHAAQRLHVPP